MYLMKLIALFLFFLLTFNGYANEVDDWFDKGYVSAQLKDYKKAVKWYTKAAEQGDARSQNNLALMYANGQGVPQDYKQAVKWYTKAAEQGDALSQFNLAFMYDNGQGVMQSKKKSYIWNAIAAANGNEDAVKNRDLDAKNLSPRGLEEAQEEAAKLYEKINARK